MTYEQALAWVHSLPRLAGHPGVENTRRLLQKLGNPQKNLRFVHVAGTNGKGSATVMLASVLRKAGLRTGANISPFVLDFCERFQVDGVMIDRETLAAILTEVHAAVQQLATEGWASIVEFDVVTAAALMWYARRHCDIVCMEVGLGGRLDSTNAIQNTLVACVMAIGKDHTELLGDTYAQIATEKCGVFKNGCDVICYPVQPPEAMATIIACAKEAGCTLHVPSLADVTRAAVAGTAGLLTDTSDTTAGKQKTQAHTALWENVVQYRHFLLHIPFAGWHQAYNAAVVAEAALALRMRGWNISDADIEDGIAEARFPARIEVLSRTPLVLLDGAHNPDGARALVRTLQEAEVAGLTAVIGILQGKAPREMLQTLMPFVQTLFTVTPDSPRALTAQQLAVLAEETLAPETDKRITACDSIAQAVRLAKQDARKKDAGLLVCGSLYLAAEARALLLAGEDKDR